MSLDPAALEAAIRSNDTESVRELLARATEAERAACTRALKRFLTGPQFHLPGPVFLAPQQFADFLGSGFRDKPGSILEQEREMTERNREYDAWREVARGIAFRSAQFGLVGGVAAATRLAAEFYHTGHDYGSADDDVEPVANILADRRPGWLADFVTRHLRAWPGGISAWRLARTLVRMGMIERPEVPEYTTLMPGSARRRYRRPDGRWTAQTPGEALRSDPELLDDEIWRLFTVVDAGRALERDDSYGYEWEDGAKVRRETWADAIADLSASGRIDRDRLLDACLDAFTSDFNPNRVGWYAGLLAQLDPSPEEAAVRSARYLRLLSLAAKDAVKVGQSALTRLVAAGSVDYRLVLGASGPPLRFPQKSIAAAQLKLVSQVAAQDPGLRGQAAATAAWAFGHDRQDVQEAALKLIRKLGVPGEPFLTEIRAHAVDLAPNLLADAGALGLTSAAEPAPPAGAGPGRPSPSGDAAELDRLERRISALPALPATDLRAVLDLVRGGGIPGPVRTRPTAGAPLPEPLTDPGEMVGLLTVLLEDARDAIAVERVMAGAVRLAGLPVAQRATLVRPLLKRARQLANTYVPFDGTNLVSDVALITLVWAGEPPPAHVGHRGEQSWNPGACAVGSSGLALTMAGIFSARAWEAARIIETGQPGLLMAEPETERGAITAATMLRRIRDMAASRIRSAGRHDLDVALLRLEPGAAGELWEAWGQLAATSPESLRVSHEQAQARLTFEPVAGLPTGHPIRASREWHEHLLARIVPPVPQAPSGNAWQLLTDLPDPLAQHEVLYGPARFESRRYDPAVAGWSLICPWQPALAAAHLLRPLCDGLVPGSTPATTAIETMRHPGHSLGPVGHLGLVVGLASAAADTRIASAQLWSDAAADGRLDPVLAAAAISAGVRGGVLKLSRIADALLHASHAPLPARRIVETVCISVDSFAPYAPTGMHQLVELAARLATRVGAPELPDGVLQLAGRRESTRIVTTAGQLVLATEIIAPERGDAAARALAAHIERAEAGELR